MAETSIERCKRYRRRILDISQQCRALHIGSAFSCMEIVDTVYHDLLQPGDTFVMSKGHGWLAQAVVLEDLGILPRGNFLDQYGSKDAPLGVHPELGVPGIVASTGSLGHGFPMAVGMALADCDHVVYVLISDGELQEGSTWEAILQATSFGLWNLVLIIDNNDLQSLGRTSETHPSMYPIFSKLISFGWRGDSVHGHHGTRIYGLLRHGRTVHAPFFVLAETKKGWPISFMQDQPIWHYRSPTPDEYSRALEELK